MEKEIRHFIALQVKYTEQVKFYIYSSDKNRNRKKMKHNEGYSLSILLASFITKEDIIQLASLLQVREFIRV